jgi:S-adenosyl-L-methionine hydrolase (adenosine-forming)
VSLLPGVIPVPRDEDGEVVAEVLWVDHFGNAQLNVGPEDVEAWGERIRLRLPESIRTATRAATYGELGPGAVGLVLDSYGLLSVALDRRSAADELGLAAGDAVRLVRLDDLGDDGDGGPGTTPVALSPRRQ